MNTKELQLAFEQNEFECFATMNCLPSVAVKRAGAFSLIDTGEKFWLFNGVFRVRPEVNRLREVASEWIKHFDDRKIPFGVFLSPLATSSELSNVLQDLGFQLSSESVVIGFDISKLDSMKVAPLSSDFQVRRVDEASLYDHYIQCFNEVFGVPESMSGFLKRWALAYGFEESRPFQNLVVMHKGRAVAIANYFLHSGIAGIYGIGVLPEFRKQGIGTEVTRTISQLAIAHGAGYLVGSGSEEGMRVYRKADIIEVGRSQRWVYEGRR